MKVVTLGTFDMLHAGHLKLFKKCLQFGDLIVGLNTDKFVERFKGKKPIMSYKERRTMLIETGFVDIVFRNDQADGNAKKAIMDSGARMIVVGSDWARKDYIGQLGLDWDWLDKNGIGICYVNYTKGISTTELKRRLNENIISDTAFRD